MNLPFDARSCDVWSSAVILFNLLTGEILYEEPHPENLLFRYFLLGKGISSTPLNERTAEILMEVQGGEQISLLDVAQKVMALDPQVLELLEGMLSIMVQERWSLEQVRNSAWVNRNSA